jgi:hypothetical protein
MEGEKIYISEHACVCTVWQYHEEVTSTGMSCSTF